MESCFFFKDEPSCNELINRSFKPKGNKPDIMWFETCDASPSTVPQFVLVNNSHRLLIEDSANHSSLITSGLVGVCLNHIENLFPPFTGNRLLFQNYHYTFLFVCNSFTCFYTYVYAVSICVCHIQRYTKGMGEVCMELTCCFFFFFLWCTYYMFAVQCRVRSLG